MAESDGDYTGAGALLLAGLISSAGSIYANRQNLKANQQRWLQSIELSNTAHQREVADLRKAGLNPILSADGSGASVPSLGAAVQENIGEGLSDGISSASKFLSKEYQANIANLKANTANVTLENSAKTMENEVRRIQSENEIDMESAVQEAQDDVLGIRRVYSDDGTLMKLRDPEKYKEAVDEIARGIRSDLAMRGNANARAWISSAKDAMGAVRDGVETIQDVGIKGAHKKLTRAQTRKINKSVKKKVKKGKRK